MTVTYHHNIIQGSDEWYAIRCGCLTASEMKLIISPKKLEYANNEKEKSHLYELAAQRITKYVEPTYVSSDMLRGQEDEVEAKILYEKNFSKVKDVGFVTNDKWGFTLGYSPDGLVSEDGLIEIKSRRQKYQFQTIVENTPPEEYWVQLQTGLLVSERKWTDFISYSGGMPLFPCRVYPDKKIQDAIVEVATTFHEKLEKAIAVYQSRLESMTKIIPTERRKIEEIVC